MKLKQVTDAGTAASKNAGSANGNVPLNGAALGNSKSVETDGSGNLITVGRLQSGYLSSTYTNATQTHSNVTGITITIPAGEVWSFEIWGCGQLSGASGARFQITYSNTPTASMVTQQSNAASLVAQADFVSVAVPPGECNTIMNVATTEERFFISGCVINSGTACTVQLQARCVGSGQTLTIRPACYIVARKIG